MDEDSGRNRALLSYNIRSDEIPTETRLQSEIAALKYKNERLNSELKSIESELKAKDHSSLQLNNEIDCLKENSARINAINASLQKRLQELDERERNISLSNQKNESELKKCKYENQLFQERILDLESQLRSNLIDREASEHAKESAQRNILEFSRKIATAIDMHEDSSKTEIILKKVYDIYQENTRFRMKISSLEQSLESLENENKSSSDVISRLNSEKDSLNHQLVNYLKTIESLKMEKEELLSEKSYNNNEIQALRDRAVLADRTVIGLHDQIKVLEQQLKSTKENLMVIEDKNNRSETELKKFQESVSIQLSSGSRLVEASPIGIRDKIKDIQIELREKQFSNDQLREKVGRLTETCERLDKILSDTKGKQEDALNEKLQMAKRLEETETQLTTTEVLNEGLRRDKGKYMQFLEQLGSILGLDEVTKEVGFDLQTEAIISRAEQLSKLEGDRLADRTATVHQLQRRLRTLKEQVEKKDLHLDMLRRKITLLEDSIKIRTTLELERNEACMRSKKLMKQIERNELDLREARISLKDLKSQLTDAAEYKIISLERARKIEELENKINDLELLRVKYNRKNTLLKDQLKISRENTNQERDLNDHAFQKLSSDLNSSRKNLVESSRREAQLLNLKNMVGKILGIETSNMVPDYELVAKLEKIVATNREFAQVSRKLSDSIKLIPGDELSSRESDDFFQETGRKRNV